MRKATWRWYPLAEWSISVVRSLLTPSSSLSLSFSLPPPPLPPPPSFTFLILFPRSKRSKLFLQFLFFFFRELLDFSKTAWVQDAFNKEFKASGGPLLFLDERRTLKSKSGKHFVCKGRLSDGTEVYRHHVITAKIGTNQICDFWHLEKTCNRVLKRRKLGFKHCNVFMDQCQYLNSGKPTLPPPPNLATIDWYIWVHVGRGDGWVCSCSHADIDPLSS